jgi:arginyl-tRNA synthetase
VIIRSDGTVTYVGKDIAYQLWKFGLLGRDFNYRPWDSTDLWQTCTLDGVAEHPAFGGAHKVINVIDARQSYLQKIVRAGLQAMGHDGEAERSIHFAYEMVSLSTGTARQLGYLQDDESGSGRSLEMSGRKGIGVKADDLLDQMQSKARRSVEGRYPDLDPAELDELGRQIATAALRFFMVKATTTRVIAFDLEDALSFEGETGPYLQYSIVRERNIRRKLAAAGRPTEVSSEVVGNLGSDLWEDDLWDLVLSASTIAETVEKAAESLELSLIARQALDLAGKFHSTYHRHNILNEDNENLRQARMASNQVFRHSLLTLFDLLGLSVPEKM